jgi:hypothetical protein
VTAAACQRAVVALRPWQCSERRVLDKGAVARVLHTRSPMRPVLLVLAALAGLASRGVNAADPACVNGVRNQVS